MAGVSSHRSKPLIGIDTRSRKKYYLPPSIGIRPFYALSGKLQKYCFHQAFMNIASCQPLYSILSLLRKSRSPAPPRQFLLPQLLRLTHLFRKVHPTQQPPLFLLTELLRQTGKISP